MTLSWASLNLEGRGGEGTYEGTVPQFVSSLFYTLLLALPPHPKTKNLKQEKRS